jgi:hypothetical protein
MMHQDEHDQARRSAVMIRRQLAEADRSREEERDRDQRRLHESGAVPGSQSSIVLRRERDRLEREATALLPAEWKQLPLWGYVAAVGTMAVVLFGAASLGNMLHGPSAAGVWGLPLLLLLMLWGAAFFDQYNDRLRTRRFLQARNLMLAPKRGLTFWLRRRRRQKELEMERAHRWPSQR